jgi:hypothetical protein
LPVRPDAGPHLRKTGMSINHEFQPHVTPAVSAQAGTLWSYWAASWCFGQQLLPHRQRIASGLMMGVTWAVASPIAAGTIELFEHLDCPVDSLYAFGAILGASSALCCCLPLNHTKDDQDGALRWSSDWRPTPRKGTVDDGCDLSQTSVA